MDILRSKKRGFFSVSHGEGQNSNGKKKLKAVPVPVIHVTTNGGSNGDFQREITSKDDLDSSDISTNSSTGPDTGSSCDDINKASKKQQMFAKKSIQRDKKKEKEKMERKEKNKLSMDDFLLKQIEFHMWLEEEKNKVPKEISSPKKKAYFKSFVKLWNKKKLSLKYYRGTAEAEHPCPSKKIHTFSFADDDDNTNTVVTFRRPKSKRLSVEPCGLLDSPFSTFGKTPPKQLTKTSLQQLDDSSPVMSLQPTCTSTTVQKDTKDHQNNDTLPVLGDYQEPLNALTPVNNRSRPVKGSVVPYLISPYPWKPTKETNSCPPTMSGQESDNKTDGVVQDESSPVYAVPWKAKCKDNRTTAEKKANPFTSPPPPPVPPKPSCLLRKPACSSTDHRSYEQVEGESCQNKINQESKISAVQHDSAVCVVEMRNNGEIHTEVKSDPYKCVTISHDKEQSRDVPSTCCSSSCLSPTKDGWNLPVSAKPFSPPVQSKTTFFSPEVIYEEIPFYQDLPVENAANEASSNITNMEDSYDTAYTSLEVREVEDHTAAEDVRDFSFSKYLILSGPAEASRKPDTCTNSSETYSSQHFSSFGYSTCGDMFKRDEAKRKPIKNETRFMPRVTEAPQNSRYLIANKNVEDTPVHINDEVLQEPDIHCEMNGDEISNKTFIKNTGEVVCTRLGQPLLGSKSPRRNIPELGKQGWQLRTPEKPTLKPLEEQRSKSENKVPKRKQEITPKSERKMKEQKILPINCLETDIDSVPVPVMGSKTPPRQRKPLMLLQRSKSMETIIW